MKDSETLLAAKALIADPETWTQKANARDITSRPVFPHSQKAVCFCANGAIIAANRGDPYYSNYGNIARKVTNLLKDRNSPYHGYTISTFNDLHSHDEVMKFFDWLIAQFKLMENT